MKLIWSMQRGHFMLYWPCISIHLSNKNQLDVLFILSLFRQSTSTCFGHICSPSSGGILYIYNNWYVLCFLVDYSQLKSTTCTSCMYVCSIPPDDGLQICLQHVEVDIYSNWYVLCFSVDYRQSTKKHNSCQLLYIYSIPPDDGLHICVKHIEIDVYDNWYVLCFLVGYRQSTKKRNLYQLLYIHSILPNDGLQICPKHVGVYWWNKLGISSASNWFSLHGCIEMHCQQNVQFNKLCQLLSPCNITTL